MPERRRGTGFCLCAADTGRMGHKSEGGAYAQQYMFEQV
jgi:hypothetical protein